MYLSQAVVLDAYKGLKKLFPNDGGKSRQERVSALKYYIAASKLTAENEIGVFDLSPQSPDNRSKFIDVVGSVVKLDGSGHYTKDFAQLIDSSSDYAVGSNFLTTRVNASKGQEKTYPGRPAPLLKLENEIVSILPDAKSTVLSDYNLKDLQVELTLWLARFLELGIQSGNPEVAEVANATEACIRTEFGDYVADFVLAEKSALVSFLGNHADNLVEDQQPDLLPIVAEAKQVTSNEPSAQDIILLEQDDSNLELVKSAKNQKGECNFLFFGAPGTGKTWYAKKIAQTLANGDDTRIKFLQFHPSVSYDDFVEGFVPSVDSDSKSITYSIEKKHFLEFADLAAMNPDQDYFLVIDEISRGDPARVFGELLTYIEPSYRGQPFSLIYSKNIFEVPVNLIIIATANPYDRSVSELDDAFLRRFYMVEFKSDTDVLRHRLTENKLSAADSQKIIHFFNTIDQQLPYGFGHAQFFNVFSTDDISVLWKSKLRFIIRRSLQFEIEKFEAIEVKFNELFPETALANSEQNASDEITSAGADLGEA